MGEGTDMVALVRESEIAGETFLEMGAALLVKSKSQANTWYELTGQSCTCPGFTYRGKCRHLVAAAERAAQLEAETTTDVEITTTTECGGGWIVKWAGHQHGGVHHNREDADGHADELRHAPAWDRQAWIERHAYDDAPAPVPTGRPSLRIVEAVR
jgi:hypothetical protein